MADFTAFFGRPPDQAGAEDLRRYQVHMRSQGATATTMNAAVSALRFFFGVTLGRADAQTGMTTVREPRRLSVILSPEEVARLLDAAPLAFLSNGDRSVHIIMLPTSTPLTPGASTASNPHRSPLAQHRA